MPKLRHAFVNAKSDGGDTTIVRPTDWNAALQYTDGSGAPSGTDATIREILTAARTYYVRSDGSDSNTGLVNSSGGAFLTIQKAVDVAAALDTNLYNVTISCGAATRTELVRLRALVGGGRGIVVGDNTTPSNCVMSPTGSGHDDAPFYTNEPSAWWSIGGFKLSITTAGNCVSAYAGKMSFHGKMEFAGAVNGLVVALGGSIEMLPASGDPVSTLANTYSGSANYCHLAYGGGIILDYPTSHAFTGTPTYAYTADAESLGYIEGNVAWTGSVTTNQGRYFAGTNAVIQTWGSGANFYPGTIAGSTATGGQYG